MHKKLRLAVVPLLLIIILLPYSAGARAGEISLIIDTDAAVDDLMAIAFLLARKDVRIEAITVTNGLAHVRPGGMNVRKLLELGGKKDVPVYLGRETPLRGQAEFPKEWRLGADELSGVQLPMTSGKPEAESAGQYLVKRLQDPRHPARILALGPLTNLGEVLQRAPQAAQAIDEMVIMGGAVGVPGNLSDIQTDNKTAEWNFFIDPLAASLAFASGIKITLVPLDATNKVPIDLTFLREFQAKARTPLGRVVGQLLESSRPLIEENSYFAWDPLAAVVLVDPSVVTLRSAAIAVKQEPPEEGRTVEVAGHPPNARVAVDAKAAEFKRIFFGALASQE